VTAECGVAAVVVERGSNSTTAVIATRTDILVA
jgi:hypothetical protein